MRRAIEWLNAQPGRKRTVAALAAGVSVTLRALGLNDWAELAEGVPNVAALVVPGVDVMTLLMAAWGIVDKWLRSRQGLKDAFVDKATLQPVVRTPAGPVKVERRTRKRPPPVEGPPGIE